MAKARFGIGSASARTGVKKKTSISGKHSMVKFASMNKSRKASYKQYRGQGK